METFKSITVIMIATMVLYFPFTMLGGQFDYLTWLYACAVFFIHDAYTNIKKANEDD